MIIKKIKLRNIRSYVDCEFDIKEGATLLAGDVGAGKSSILLAIDFALFGLTRGSLSGSSLLRNGSSSGYVEMDFTIDDKDISIKRKLTRSKSILQDEGMIRIDDKLINCTTMELKQYVLDLLNYPKDLLRKSKGLIYRYTVYTPQEEMKRILWEEDEIRVDTLRKIFGIDKYKRMKENSEIFSNYIREKVKSDASYTADINAKAKELNEYKENCVKLKNELELIRPRLEEMKKTIELKKRYLEDIEIKLMELNKLRKDFDVNNMKLKYINNETNSIKRELEEIDIKLSSYHDVRRDIEFRDVEEFIKKEKLRLGTIENSYRDILGQISVIKSEINNSNIIIEKVNSLNVCPVCKQRVEDLHKNEIRIEERNRMSNLNNKLAALLDESRKLQENINKSNEKIDVLNEENRKTEVDKIKIKSLNEIMSKKEYLSKKQDTLKIDVKDTEELIKNIHERLSLFEGVEMTYSAGRIGLDKYQTILRELDVKYSMINTRFIDNNKMIKLLESEVLQKQAIKERVQNMDKIRMWLNDIFIGLIGTMEKRVMLKIYCDFNELFKKWFNVIMGGDEGLVVGLDGEFSPSIEQNGYYVEYGNLSGGEKTAVALAYRLALNQVINNMVVDIKTNDLLILDEPTDGFSDDQIDRIKYVLDELDIKQVIIVSHEPRIESFVDNIIRISKENHVSSVITNN